MEYEEYKNYFDQPDHDSGPKLPFYNLEITSIPVCNMACTYCFEGEELQSKKRQKVQNIDDIITKIKDLSTFDYFRKNFGGITINFWGGEPTLNHKWNIELVKRLYELEGNEVPKDFFRFFIYTNGFHCGNLEMHLLDIDKYFHLSKLMVQISYDGSTTADKRVDHKGKPTYEKVKETIKYITKKYPLLDLSLKATIEPIDLLDLPEIHNEYHKLHKEMSIHSNWRGVSLSPTLNYIDDFEPKYMEEYKKQLHRAFQETLYQEFMFYKFYSRNLLSWFKNDHRDPKYKRTTNCSAGINIGHIDLDGKYSVCHGSEYSTHKNNFVFTDLNRDKKQFLTSFKETREALLTVHQDLDYECRTCSATVCYKCPIVNVERTTTADTVDTNTDSDTNENSIGENTIKNFQNRDPRHCFIYKIFGIYDTAFWKLLKENKYV